MRRLHEGSRNNDMEKEQNKTTKSCNTDKHIVILLLFLSYLENMLSKTEPKYY